MAVALWPQSLVQFFDDTGAVLNGGKINTYEAGTSTPLATYTDSGGGSAHPNPIILDAAGRVEGGIWITEDVSYKFVVTTSADVTVDTIDDIIVDSATASTTTTLRINFGFIGNPTSSQVMGLYAVSQSLTLGVDFEGSYGEVTTNPGSSTALIIKKNGSQVGTATISTGGVYTFATDGGAQVTLSAGDALSLVNAASADGSLTDVAINLKATL